jgi:hypothetical protein
VDYGQDIYLIGLDAVDDAVGFFDEISVERGDILDFLTSL